LGSQPIGQLNNHHGASLNTFGVAGSIVVGCVTIKMVAIKKVTTITVSVRNSLLMFI
jgi:hypothetical protein